MFVCTYSWKSLFWRTAMQDPHLSMVHYWGFYSTFLGTILDSKSCAWSSTREWLACSRLQNHLLHFSLDVLMTPHFSSRTGNQDSTPSEYWQPILQKCGYMGLMSLEYFSISPSGKGQQIIPDGVISWVCIVTWNLKALALMDVVWFVYKVSSRLWCWNQCHLIHTGKPFQSR